MSEARLRSGSRRLWVVLLSLLIGTWTVEAASDATGVELETRWYRCTLGGRPCGRMLQSTVPVEGGGTRTTIDLELRFRRGEVETSTRIRTAVVLGPDDAVQRMDVLRDLGGSPASTRWIFGDSEVIERRSLADSMVESRRPRPAGEWHVPDLAMEIARKRAAEGEPSRLRVLDPARGLEPAVIAFRRIGTEWIRIMNRDLEVDRWEITDPDGSVTMESFDSGGRLVSSEVPMGAGLGVLRIELATESDASLALEGGVELMEAGAVRPAFEGRPRRLDRGGEVSYRIWSREADLDLPTAAAQRTLTLEGEREALVSVRPGATSAVEEGFDRDSHLAATSLLDASDPAVIAFTRRHDRVTRTDGERINLLRAAVHRHITRKDLATGFATASETVRRRRGDCTEHAVLLAAALRSAGIPSRLVNGLVWIPRAGERAGIFLWHMWVQAVVDDEWIDLDPSLAGGRAFHPGHLAVSFSSGDAGDLETGGRAMLDLFGSIEVEVLAPDSDRRGGADE